MIDALRSVLEGIGYEVSSEDLADLLWLARRVVVSPADGDAGEADGGEAGASGLGSAADGLVSDAWNRTAGGSVAYHSDASSLGGSTVPADLVRVPAVRAVENPRSLGRALSALKRRVRTGRETEIDEAATTAMIAETGVWDVVTKPAAERWLDLVLVIDDGLSMLLWRQLADELRVLFQSIGAFRSVRIFGLDAGDPERVRLTSRPFDSRARTLGLATAGARPGRTALVVVSDGVGAAWRNGVAQGQLAKWTRQSAVAVLQPLPPRLWDGTGIQPVRHEVRTEASGSGIARLEVRDSPMPEAAGQAVHNPIPVIEMHASALRAWAAAVTGSHSKPVLWLLDPAVPPTAAKAVDVGAMPDGEESLAAFRTGSSPEAYWLAAHLAAVSPIRIPTMFIVQEHLDGATRTNLAEVFLGGLLRRQPDGDGFEFAADTRALLEDTLDHGAAEVMRARVGQAIESWSGVGSATSALVPAAQGTQELRAGPQPFAIVVAEEEEVAQASAVFEAPRKTPTVSTPLRDRGSAGSASPYPVFFSYAHIAGGDFDENPNRAFQRFFEDISKMLYHLTTFRMDVAFADISLHSGDAFQNVLFQRLSQFRAFVPILSTRYFENEWCGREWAAFERRSQRQGSGSYPPIVPILWNGLDDLDLPQWFTEQHLFDDSTHDALYRQHGIFGLQIRQRDEYNAVVYDLARRISAVIRTSYLPEVDPEELRRLPPFFGGTEER